MKLKIEHQEKYSRGQLLLRTFFGFFYIVLPHYILLIFVLFWSFILGFITFWAVLFTAKFPKKIFDFQIKVGYWINRIIASLFNLVDGYPSIGVNGKSDKVSLDVEYPEKLSRGLFFLRFLALFYVFIPHGFCLFFRKFATSILMFLAWWTVLFTGKYPKSFHDFNVGTIRWGARIILYMGLFTDVYPPYSGKE